MSTADRRAGCGIFGPLMVAQIVLLALKASGAITTGWGWTLLPTWIAIAITLFAVGTVALIVWIAGGLNDD